jgi:hypothetical protein
MKTIKKFLSQFNKVEWLLISMLLVLLFGSLSSHSTFIKGWVIFDYLMILPACYIFIFCIVMFFYATKNTFGSSAPKPETERKSMETVNDFIKLLQSISEEKRKLPLHIECPNGMDVYPNIKIQFKNGTRLTKDAEVEKLVITWRD